MRSKSSFFLFINGLTSCLSVVGQAMTDEVSSNPAYCYAYVLAAAVPGDDPALACPA
jgi:hypothetical protein